MNKYRSIEDRKELQKFEIWEIDVEITDRNNFRRVRNISFIRNPIKAVEHALRDIQARENLPNLGNLINIRITKLIVDIDTIPPYDPDNPEE